MTQPSKTKFFLNVLATSAVLVAGIETIRPQQVLAIAGEENPGVSFGIAMTGGDINAIRAKAEEFLCGDKRVQVRSRLISAVDYIVDPVEQQAVLLNEVRTKAMENDGIISKACESFHAMGQDFPAMMEKRRLVLTTALQVMDNIQPSVKAFYESLNEEQIGRLKAVMPPAIAQKL